jgi:hypothetical protein
MQSVRLCCWLIHFSDPLQHEDYLGFSRWQITFNSFTFSALSIVSWTGWYRPQETCTQKVVLRYYFKRVIMDIVRRVKNSTVSNLIKNDLTEEATLINVYNFSIRTHLTLYFSERHTTIALSRKQPVRGTEGLKH